MCYVCAIDCPSSQLRLVYCCANAEREPYYPFIKTKSAPPNASPISPQGMVQICVSCNQQNMHLAEGGTPGNNPSSSDERLLQFSNSVASSQQSQREQVPIHVPSSQQASAQAPLQSHMTMTGSTNPSGNPSSLAASKSHDSASMSVRYKVSRVSRHLGFALRFQFSSPTTRRTLPKIPTQRIRRSRKTLAVASRATLPTVLPRMGMDFRKS